MRHGSLFSGIGGFDLAAQWMGWENVFHCEINPFCQKVLKKHFPNADSYEDITKFNGGGIGGKLTLFPEGGLVKNTQSRDTSEVMNHSKMKCLEYLERSRPDLEYLKTLAILLVQSLPENTTICVSAWKIWDTKCRRLILTLRVVDYLQWNGTYGLLPRITVSDSKGSPMSRTRTNNNFRAFKSIIRENREDGTLANPDFCEWVKGFPEGWTDLGLNL